MLGLSKVLVALLKGHGSRKMSTVLEHRVLTCGQLLCEDSGYQSIQRGVDLGGGAREPPSLMALGTKGDHVVKGHAFGGVGLIWSLKPFRGLCLPWPRLTSCRPGFLLE